MVDGLEFDVTSNLEAALRALRSRGHKKVWVDALCINQKDLTERSLQVLRMGIIYSKAKNVLVWLGPASKESDSAFDYMEGKEFEAKKEG